MQRINLLIVLMFVALMALIGFQWYWIQNSIKEKREKFDQNVNMALQKTSEAIEKQELAYLTKQKIKQKEAERLLMIAKSRNKPVITRDSMNLVYRQDGQLRINPQQTISIHFEDGIKNDVFSHKLFIYPEQETELMKGFLEDETINMELFFEQYNAFLSKKNVVESMFSDLDIKKANANKKILKEVLKDLMVGKRTINERFNKVMIDTLLKAELKDAGITTPYQYGVKDGPKYVFTSFVKSDPKLRNYKVKLFGNNTVNQNQSLEVFFPEKEKYIFKNMWASLIGSGLMVLMVGLIFGYSVNTLLSQKKLANIKNDFINNMTHELKTPVSTIGLAMEILKDKSINLKVEKIDKYLDIIEQENKRLGTHIEKVLNIARLEKGDLKLNLETLDLSDVIKDSINNISLTLDSKQGEIKFVPSECVIKADKLHIGNILYNLMENAIKYCEQRPIILIDLKQEGDKAILKIKDNGEGIKKEYLDKIFDKFYRIPKGDVHDTKGYGLGLSYVKQMLKLHAGEISVQSTAGVGSEFEIILPLMKTA